MDVHAVPFRLSLASLPRHALTVRELHGREKLSGHYRFDLTCTAREPLPPLADLLQSAAVMTIWIAGSPRVFSGAVAAVAHEGTRRDAEGSEQIRVRIVPRFALRKHRKNSRIFQGLPIPEIVKAVLAEAGVPVELRLRHQYPDRVYCTQYQETDTAFVARVLAEAGIFSFWRPPSASPASVESLEDAVWGGDTLVLGDTPSAYQEAATPLLSFLHAGGTLGHEAGAVTRFVPRAAVRPERATFREYDMARPRAILEGSAEVPGRDRSPLEIYDHEAPFLFSGWKVTEQEPDRRLQSARGEAQLAQGESTAPHLAAGHRFTLESHSWEPANGSHVVLEVRHEGWATPQGQRPERYRNRFVTAPAVEAVSPRGPRQRTLGFTLTATVTGPPGDEIHVDEQGRIKAQFHWDREGKQDDRSSCWLRVMQAWSGTGWGSQFIPRVGMEVVVVFEGGDPDKPMVIGTLSNGTHPPPFVLPGDKTRSGFKSRSTPASEGFNELSFEDAAGAELLTLRAEKNLQEAVGHDRESVIGHDRTTTVQGASTEEVRGSRTRTVGGGEAVTIRGASTFAVDGARTETIGGAAETRTRGDREVSTGGDETSDIGGDRKATVCGSDHVIAKVARSVIVGTSTERRGDSLNFVWGRATHRTSGVSEFVSDEAIVLRSGKSTIEILPDRIRISAPTIETVATKEVVLRGGGDGGPVLKLTDRAEILAKEMNFISESARLSLKKNASVRGEKILLNSDEQGLSDATGEVVAPDTVKVALRLFDDNQTPYADRPHAIVVGSVMLQGTTDGAGRMSATVPAVAKTGRITVWKADFPTGPTQEWVLSLEAVGEADSPPDLQKRLANLGFPSGPPAAEVTPRLKEALRAYQAANQLDVTGEADPETLALLHIIHP